MISTSCYYVYIHIGLFFEFSCGLERMAFKDEGVVKFENLFVDYYY